MINFDSGIGRVTGYSLVAAATPKRRARSPEAAGILGSENHTYDARSARIISTSCSKAFPRSMHMEEANYLPNYQPLQTRWTK